MAETDRTGGFLGRIMPQQRIVISCENRTRQVTLSPLSQLLIGTTAVIGFGWTTISTAALVLTLLTADDRAQQVEVTRGFYEHRIAELGAERDTFAREAEALQSRFVTALETMSTQQGELLALVEESRELSTALDLMRDKLKLAVAERDKAETERKRISAEFAELSGDLDSRIGNTEDLTVTLDAMTEALGRTVTARDAARRSATKMESELAGLEFRQKVQADLQLKMIEELEEAVEGTLRPLEQLFASTGLDTNHLLRTVRSSYSGAGGPDLPASGAITAFSDDAAGERFASLMQGMDKINLMKIAAEKLPYSAPVSDAYRFTSGFGVRRDPVNGGARRHNGVDFAAPRGTPIHSTADGVVIFAGRQSGFGNVVKVRHEFGFETLYAHLSKIRVKKGERVSRGDRIGDMGTTGRSTGVHLHYEIHVGGKPVNPMTYLKAAKNVL